MLAVESVPYREMHSTNANNSVSIIKNSGPARQPPNIDTKNIDQEMEMLITNDSQGELVVGFHHNVDF